MTKKKKVTKSFDPSRLLNSCPFFMHVPYMLIVKSFQTF